MIQINVMSRISEDKNFFFDVIYILHKLKDAHIYDVQLLFIGDIITVTLYNDMIKLGALFNINDQIAYTRKSVRFAELPLTIQQGYFLNFTVGDFTGYSGIESLKMGFKTIFYNIDELLATSTEPSVSYCPNIDSLFDVCYKINADPKLMDTLILADNLKMKNKFLLGHKDVLFLKSTME